MTLLDFSGLNDLPSGMIIGLVLGIFFMLVGIMVSLYWLGGIISRLVNKKRRK